MPRLLFEKTGSAVWISHLDLMRLFQRAFKRAGLPLTHTHGFNPRPSVSIALPLSVGVESQCELLDFDLEEYSFACQEITDRLNAVLVPGIRVLETYDDGRKIREIALLECRMELEYDRGAIGADLEVLTELFSRKAIPVEKKGKNGITEVDIKPMIQELTIVVKDANTLMITALICCQNPSLNPMLMAAAIERYAPEAAPDHVRCCRLKLFDTNYKPFR